MEYGFLCSHCNVLAQMKEEFSMLNTENDYEYTMYECANCSNPIFRCYTVITDTNQDLKKNDVVFQYPSLRINTHNSVPEEISKLYSEGVTCLIANAANGAMICFRKCVQTFCKHRGANPKYQLWQQIDSVLRDNIKELSLEIKKLPIIGLDSDNFTEGPSLEQAKRVKEFLDIIFIDEFEMPAKIKTSKQRITNA